MEPHLAKMVNGHILLLPPPPQKKKNPKQNSFFGTPCRTGNENFNALTVGVF